MAHKKKNCAYFSTFYTYSFISLWHVGIGSDHNLVFLKCIFKSTSFILVNLQAVAGGKIRRTLIMHDNDNDNDNKQKNYTESRLWRATCGARF